MNKKLYQQIKTWIKDQMFNQQIKSWINRYNVYVL